MQARVSPHPGQGTPVKVKNGHCQDGRCSDTKTMWRPSIPLNTKPTLRSRNIVAKGQEAVSDDIAARIL
jgi:hypothetical protein